MKFLKTKLLFVGAMFVLATQAQALLLTASDAYTTATIWNTANDPDILNPDAADITTITGDTDVVGLYKDEISAELGEFKDSYTTTYFDLGGDPEYAKITYDGSPDPVMDANWLVVKDGNHDPRWYLFDLSASGLNWNGTDTIQVGDANNLLWPRGGSISHVHFLGSVKNCDNPQGCEPTEVPEPQALALIGLGLIGMYAARRRVGADK
jgi:hypothetical protein